MRGEIKHQRVNGKMRGITLNQRRGWLQVARQTAETIRTITTNINEKEVKDKMEELEKLLKEVTDENT
ncbi:MAG: hypothetical protein RMJ07_05785 [Nitrososphaerota archaeon]|nr:hypothetical protein [Candidatus Bathyarchaeota archaeon]MDW8049170.1 hypothetical protein [Nitrososphaerota archaeon]